jgi:hypothetical protein
VRILRSEKAPYNPSIKPNGDWCRRSKDLRRMRKALSTKNKNDTGKKKGPEGR